MRPVIVFFCLLLLSVSSVSALVVPNLADIKDSYNSNLDKIPGFVKTILGSERINVVVHLDDDSLLKFQAITKDGSITTLDYGELENATIIVSTSEKVINTIQASSNPVNALELALDNNDIKVEPQTFAKKVEWGMAETIMRIVSWFRNLFGGKR